MATILMYCSTKLYSILQTCANRQKFGSPVYFYNYMKVKPEKEPLPPPPNLTESESLELESTFKDEIKPEIEDDDDEIPEYNPEPEEEGVIADPPKEETLGQRFLTISDYAKLWVAQHLEILEKRGRSINDDEFDTEIAKHVSRDLEKDVRQYHIDNPERVWKDPYTKAPVVGGCFINYIMSEENKFRCLPDHLMSEDLGWVLVHDPANFRDYEIDEKYLEYFPIRPYADSKNETPRKSTERDPYEFLRVRG